ncbi:MAG TPA: HAD hydrolase family protein [Burkholderiales bacterium]|nr:HAD hydrolase family protein [Burkholderiales bacterium]
MHYAAPDALERARRVKLMVFDVDGVLTDGRLWYGPSGEEIKAFHSFDGQGIKMLTMSGVHAALLSGRSSPAVSSRAAELGVEHVLQGIADKRAALEGLLRRLGFAHATAGAMGDDLVDLPVLTRCIFSATVPEAPEEVRRRVHYVASSPAGGGAAREVCEFVMRAQGTLDDILARYLE